MKSILYAGILMLAAAAPAAAQEYNVNRRLFTFLDNEVTVEVTAQTEGTLHVVRGEPGRLEVAARVDGGMSTFALGGRDGTTLRLTAVGGDNASFIVVVPEDTYLRVFLPNQKSGEVGSSRPGGSFSWPHPDAGEYAAAPAMMPAPDGLATAHVAEAAPRVLNVPRLNSARTITVQLQAGLFEVGGTRWMSVKNGSTTNVEIRTGSTSEDLFINIPYGTRDFTLKLGGKTAMVIRGPEVTTYCEPVLEQILYGGAAQRFTFTPEMGRLRCR